MKNDDNIKIFDVYNKHIYPGDFEAESRIDFSIPLFSGTSDDYFLKEINNMIYNTDKIKKFKPEFIIYNAGTDCLINDPLGCLRISQNGIIKRDEIIFTFARNNNIPILMVLSGGYQMNNANIIGNSINNLKNKGLLHCNSHDNSTD